MAQPSTVEPQFRPFFAQYVDRRSLSEQALNLVGLTDAEVGRSFALVAGVDVYTGLALADRSLPAAALDVEKFTSYLRDVEQFDEIVVLTNAAVSDETLKYFLQAYFPARLRQFPKSRFVFAYSGHGFQEGVRGYLLLGDAVSLDDKAHSISLSVLRTLYGEIVDTAYQSLALINACSSGAFQQRAFGGQPMLPRLPGAHAITASTASGRAFSDGQKGHGSIFFEKVLSGLDGAADSGPVHSDGTTGDGVITVPELFAYLSMEVPAASAGQQVPLAGDLAPTGSPGGLFFLNRLKQERAGLLRPAPSVPRPLRSFGDPDAEAESATLTKAAESSLADGSGPEAVRGLQKACAWDYAPACKKLAAVYLDGAPGVAKDVSKAVEVLRAACDRGNTSSCTGLAAIYAEGTDGVRKQMGSAVAIYQNACDVGEPVACTNLGLIYWEGGEGIPVDRAKAIALTQKACDWDSGMACGNLGIVYGNGDGAPKDLDRAARLYEKGCRLEDEHSCGNLARAYALGLGVKRDERKAEGFFAKACDIGDPRACMELARRIFEHPEEDREVGLGLMERACDRGSERGCLGLGTLFEGGKLGVTADLLAAKKWYERACEVGSFEGCNSAGELSMRGSGGAPDPAKAAKLFDMACSKGFARGCLNLGILYENGKGLPQKDAAHAVELFRQACEWKDPVGCRYLGDMYLLGRGGLSLDNREARRLYAVACEAGLKDACDALEKLGGGK